MNSLLTEIKKVADQIRGVTYGANDAIDKPQNGYIGLLRANNIQNNCLNFDDLLYVPSHKVSSLQILKRGDILIAASSGSLSIVGKAGVFKSDEKYTFGAFCKAIRPRTNIDASYLSHYFFTTEYRTIISSLAAGANINNLRNEHIDNLSIPLPPLAEQQRIAELLDTADHILKLRESAITKLDQLASTTFDEMYDALDAVSTKSLGEILELQRGASPRPIADWMTEDEDGVNWIKIADATASDKYIFKCKERIKKEAVAMTRYVKSGDFLLSNSMSFGRPYILKTDGCIHDGWLLIRDTKKVFEQDFLYAVLSCKTVKEQFKKLATGAVVKNLNIDAVSKVKVKIPEKKIQKIFSEKMHELEANKATHLKQLSIIKTLLSSLQHQSFAVN